MTKELMESILKDVFLAGWRLGDPGARNTKMSDTAWFTRGMALVAGIINQHAKEFGFDLRNEPTEPGLYWADLAPPFDGAEVLKVPQAVEVFVRESGYLSMRFVYPKLDAPGVARPLGDPRVVRYLGRVNPEPIPMGQNSG